MENMDKDQILKKLKEIDIKIKLPTNIKFDIKNNELILEIIGDAPSQNMQTDGAAFEGWVLALKNNLTEIERVKLKWKTQKHDIWEKKGFSKNHYYRFLYRVAKFKELFNWFEISPDLDVELLGSEKAHKEFGKLNDKLVINVIQKKREKPTLKDKEQRELVAEYNLVKDSEFNNKFKNKFALDTVERQIPMGVFKNGKVSHETRIFTGGASAIDIIGVNNQLKTANIFELKIDNNNKVGVISELLFYTFVIFDLLEGRIGFDSEIKIHNKSCDFYKELMECKNIKSHILIPKNTHILIDNGVLTILNNAFKVFKKAAIKDIVFCVSEFEEISAAAKKDTI